MTGAARVAAFDGSGHSVVVPFFDEGVNVDAVLAELRAACAFSATRGRAQPTSSACAPRRARWPASRIANAVRRAGLRIAEVEVNHRARLGGSSKYDNWTRARAGIYDLVGVGWLLRRSLPAPPMETKP